MTPNDIIALKPSELIDLALKDLELIEQDDKYSIRMNVYHVLNDGICYVCLAGSVLAKSLNISPENSFAPENEPSIKFINMGGKEFQKRMLALDLIRKGYKKSFINQFSQEVITLFEEADLGNKHTSSSFVAYGYNHEGFKEYLHSFSSFLTSIGL